MLQTRDKLSYREARKKALTTLVEPSRSYASVTAENTRTSISTTQPSMMENQSLTVAKPQSTPSTGSAVAITTIAEIHEPMELNSTAAEEFHSSRPRNDSATCHATRSLVDSSYETDNADNSKCNDRGDNCEQEEMNTNTTTSHTLADEDASRQTSSGPSVCDRKRTNSGTISNGGHCNKKPKTPDKIIELRPRSSSRNNKSRTIPPTSSNNTNNLHPIETQPIPTLMSSQQVKRNSSQHYSSRYYHQKKSTSDTQRSSTPNKTLLKKRSPSREKK